MGGLGRREGVHTYEVNCPARIDFFDLLLEDFGSVDGTARGGHASDEHLSAVGLEDLFNTAPVGDLQRCDGGTNSDGVETEETVAEDDGIFGSEVWSRLAGVCTERGEEEAYVHFR